MKPNKRHDNHVREDLAERSEKPVGVSSNNTPKVDPQDENFEHTLRRAVLAKERKRSMNPGLYL